MVDKTRKNLIVFLLCLLWCSCVVDYIGSPLVRLRANDEWVRVIKLKTDSIKFEISSYHVPGQFVDHLSIVIDYESLGKTKINLTPEDIITESNCYEADSSRWGIVDYERYVIHLSCKHDNFENMPIQARAEEYASRNLTVIIRKLDREPFRFEVRLFPRNN